MTSVGIVDIQSYAPERFMAAAEISQLSGIPEQVLVEKFGIVGKHIAAPDEHVTDMCISAARPILGRHPNLDIDAVVYFGSHFKDYSVWQAAPKIQHALGIEGFALEMINVSAGAPIALRIVKSMLASDPAVRSVLMVAASKESQLLDYGNVRSRFMYNFGDGGVAVLVARDHPENQVLESATITDASFSDHVSVPGGGSIHPASEATVAGGKHFMDVTDPEEMKRRLDPIAIKNFVKVARSSVEESGYALEDIAWALPIHMKRSIHKNLLVELGVPEERSIYLDHHGHMSAVDPLFALCTARDANMLASGELIMLLAAGTGYSWAATALRWG
jgi:3-oxoacyl-[acyl-carrier-protein] synthase-3